MFEPGKLFVFDNKYSLKDWSNSASLITNFTMGLYHPLDGVTNLKYKLLYFLTPNKKLIEKGTSF